MSASAPPPPGEPRPEGPGPRPLVVLAGPTASGKTVLAAALAGRAPVPLEVIGADARQIYRGLSAGTAKPAGAERRAL
ncbi:MAG: tRNA (adenosine(37)-N6)-dimethylallyltransferase MiaA, partial [Candidatus Tectomicrobia bacterium]|nr:tRNA (adenosine(37)-N6)-dimethylallyltransferase MiaA [Candidatus Tectomicrobia bacterium]